MESEEARLVIEEVPFPSHPKTNGRTLVKFLPSALSALSITVSFCFLFSPTFFALSDAVKGEVPVVKDVRNQGDPPLIKKTDALYNQLPEMALDVEKEKPGKEKCDLFSGKWIHNPSGPAYTNDTCNFIDPPQNCMRNGRPDNLYLYWRWKPYGCELPPFNAHKFLNVVRNKSWGLIGDSITHNYVESLICLLSKVEEAIEIYHDEDFRSHTWYYPSHNFTLSVIWAPLLLKSNMSVNNEGESKYPIQLHLDVVDTKWTSQYHKYDYVMFSGGLWFLKTIIFLENNTAIGCHYCEDELKELGVTEPYRKALELSLQFMATSDHKPIVIFRTWTLSHGEYFELFSGGICNRTLPYKEGQFNGTPVDRDMRQVEIDEFERAAKSGLRVKLLDVFHLSALRPDGHPGAYGALYPFAKDKHAKVKYDCLHWCLPGPIDAWHDILMEMLLNEEDLRYSH